METASARVGAHRRRCWRGAQTFFASAELGSFVVTDRQMSREPPEVHARYLRWRKTPRDASASEALPAESTHTPSGFNGRWPWERVGTGSTASGRMALGRLQCSRRGSRIGAFSLASAPNRESVGSSAISRCERALGSQGARQWQTLPDRGQSPWRPSCSLSPDCLWRSCLCKKG